MNEQDRRYLRARMQREEEMARRARTPQSAAPHRELARLYGQMLERGGPGRFTTMPSAGGAGVESATHR